MSLNILLHGLMGLHSDDAIMLTDTRTRAIISHNDALINIFNQRVVGKTLSELAASSTCTLTTAELRYCEYVESECLERERSTISLEQLHSSMYMCIRLIISEKPGDEKKILTIIKKTDTRELMPNFIYFI